VKGFKKLTLGIYIFIQYTEYRRIKS